MEYLKLNNGVEMPVEGLGTFLMTPAEAEAASLAALEAGYEHIDTANAYMNEKAVGRAIAKSGVDREKLFVSTKLWPSVYEAGDAAVDGTLARLGLEYVDMLILHQPVGDYLAAWKTMEKAYRDGKVRALGLSNFPQDKIAEVIEAAEIKPQLVTVECYPYLRAALKDDGTGAGRRQRGAGPFCPSARPAARRDKGVHARDCLAPDACRPIMMRSWGCSRRRARTWSSSSASCPTPPTPRSRRVRSWRARRASTSSSPWAAAASSAA